jgi:2-polyprenyl-3-methyl-5-hydroxy-6-metoxy-1,4-benzoquinol methylase
VSAPVCPGCGASTTPLFVARDRNRRVSDATFPYFRCSRCGVALLHPVPDDLGRYYPADYYRLPATRDQLVEGSRPHDGYKVDLIRRFAPGGRLVEVGPGIGGFVALAQDAGYDVSAIEMDARASAFLERVVGVPTHNTADADMALRSNGPFDVIALWHVIEHVRNPWATLAAAADALSPNGVIILAAPNPAALQFRLFGRKWTHVDAPRHLFLIPIEELHRTARRLGLEVALVTTTDAGTLGWNAFGWRETLAHSVKSVKLGHALRAAGSVVARIAGPLERRGHRGTTYTLVLRRPG